MKLLLDTHVVLWWLADEPLSAAATATVADPSNDVFVSAASVWEMAIKALVGKLDVDADLHGAIEADFTELAVSARHARAVQDLPPMHRDPFDRMLVVQAQLDGLVLVTRDEAIGAYDVAILEA